MRMLPDACATDPGWTPLFSRHRHFLVLKTALAASRAQTHFRIRKFTRSGSALANFTGAKISHLDGVPFLKLSLSLSLSLSLVPDDEGAP